MALGYYDSDGFYHYGEDDLADPGQGFSELLNKSTESVKNAVPVIVHNKTVDELANDATIREGANQAVTDLIASTNLGEQFGTEQAILQDERARAVFAFEDDSAPIIVNSDGYMTTEEMDTAYDVHEPGARAIWLFEDDSIGAVLYADGSFVEGGGTGLAAYEAIGDSLTWDADLANPDDGWSHGLTENTNRPLNRRGRPGARAAELAWMAGVSVISGTVPSGTTAASFTVTNLTPINPFKAGVTPAVPVVGLLDDRTTIRGQLVRNGSDATFIADEPVTVPTTSIRLRAVAVPAESTLIFGAGTNDGPTPGGGATAAEVAASIVSVIDSRPGPTVAWGPLDRGASEGVGTTRGDFIRAIEAEVSSKRPDSWWSLRTYLASEQALTDAARFNPSFTPTSADNAAVSAGAIPPSFRVIGGTNGSVHPNELGQQLVLWSLLNHLFLRGLI